MMNQNENKPLKWLLPVLILTLAALSLRVCYLDSQSMWGDEAFSLINAKDLSIGGVIQKVYEFGEGGGDSHPPLYYILLNLWIRLFGDSLIALRMLSAVFGVLTVPLFFLVGKELFSGRDGFAAAVFCTFSAFHVWYSQETRMYSLTVFLCLVSFYGFLRLLKGWRLSTVLIFLSGTIALLYTHHFGLILLFMENVYYLFSRHKHRRPVKWYLLQGVLLILYIPGLIFLYKAVFVKAAEVGLPRYFSPLLSLPFIFTKYSMFGNEMYVRNHIMIYLLGMTIFGAAFLRGLYISAGEKGDRLWLPLFFTFFPVIAVYLSPYIFSEIMYSVHSLLMFSVFYVLIIVRRTLERGYRWGLILLLLMISLNARTLVTLNYGDGYQKPRMKEAVAYIVEHSDPDTITGKLPVKLPGKGALSYHAFQYHAAGRIREIPLNGSTVEEVMEIIASLEQGAAKFWLMIHEHVLAGETNSGVIEACKKRYDLIDEKHFDSRIRNSNLVLYGFALGE